MNVHCILEKILGRSNSFLNLDIEKNYTAISDVLKEQRILVIGAAGSIGGAFVRELAGFSLSGLHLIDLSENNLAEVVRDLRSSGTLLPEDFQTFSIDYSGVEMQALLQNTEYDYILNFSAMKHVRSERDPYTLMRMIDVNVLGNVRLLEMLKNSKRLKRVFSVSSDKAVNPANLMGASKAFMERIFLNFSDEISFSSARFANVAFSDGSLLHAFRHRLEKQQPISAPQDVKRYFITHKEAGQLCLLGCFLGKNKEIFYPNFKSDKEMMSFADIARVFLREQGYEPKECKSDEEALELMQKRKPEDTWWPCHFSGSDTSGEKMYEEFVHTEEEYDEKRYAYVGVVTRPITADANKLSQALNRLNEMRSSFSWDKEQILDTVSSVVEELKHVETNRNLDQKM